MSGSTSNGSQRISSEDIWTLNRLRLSQDCTEQLLDDLVAWWQSDSPSHNLLSFLALKGVISIDSAQVWGEAAEGTRDVREMTDNFNNRHIELLKEKLARRQRVAETSYVMQSSSLSSSSFDENIRLYVEQLSNNPLADGGRLPKVGDTLGKCTLTHKLGDGGTCLVFAALHRTLNITVAVKIFSLRNRRKALVDRELFRREAQLLARLNDSRIVRILDFEDDDPPYLILEFVDGLTVSELIDRSGSIDSDQATRIAVQTAKALRFAHSWNVVHRDIKPANILLDRDGHVKLADLGMAALSVQLEQATAETPSRTVCGTPAYVAPEVIMDANSATPQSDIYSLGATLYHMITGQYPFASKTVEGMLIAHLKETPVSPRVIKGNISKYLSNLTLAMLEKKPERRPQSMEDVQEALETVLKMQDMSASTATMTTRIRRRLLSLITGDE